MQQQTGTDAAAIIAAHWNAGSKLDALPASCRPGSLLDGYRIQAALEAAMDSEVVGFKIAATASKGQQHSGVRGPIAGRVFAARSLRDGEPCPLLGNRMRVAECEFLFVLGADLPPRDAPYTRDEVAAAVAELRPALELPDSRFADFATAGAAQLAADNACAHFLVVGEPTTVDWRIRDLAAHATGLRVNDAFVGAGHGSDVLGHPLDALAWIASNHAVQGFHLRAGQFVTTGVCGTPWSIAPGDRICADLGDFGCVSTVLQPDP
jgi:2-keto-4-pentenoate hydratase